MVQIAQQAETGTEAQSRYVLPCNERYLLSIKYRRVLLSNSFLPYSTQQLLSTFWQN